MRKVIKGDLVFTSSSTAFETIKDGYLVTENGEIKEVKKDRPDSVEGEQFLDFSGKLIIPGLIDLHLHAPQFPNIGLGTDMELLSWLETYTFPEESKYSEGEYAEQVYKRLINKMWSVGTTRSALFGTIHKESSTLLYDLFIESGLGAYIGKVNMDRNSPDFYIEDTEDSITKTEEFIGENMQKSSLVKPIITPRFVPSCTPELMEALGKLAIKYDLPVQSHLDENKGEIDWVCSLHPECSNYSEVYEQFELFGQQPTLMAHCIYCNEEELKLILNRGVYAVHCPFSNANIISGIMPVKKYMELGIKVGLGSDISGGHEVNMSKVMVLAMEMSKMLAVQQGTPNEFLTSHEAFYLGTKASGEFFGKVGSFEEGYKADFLVINDEDYLMNDRSLIERVEKFMYIGTHENIAHMYIEGKEILQPFEI